MAKQTKNIITRDGVEKELRSRNKAEMRAILALCAVSILFFLPIAVLVIYGLCSSLSSIPLKVLLSVFFGGVISSPFWLTLWSLALVRKEKMLLDRGEFYIAVHPLSHKSENFHHRILKEFLHFDGFRKIVVPHTTFQLASPGDAFYLVYYPGKKEIVFLYAADMYEYK
ncbi:MAG: hypothetical protein IJ012_02140 [Clostridia bacterium]|nr:hypothetical protein [Clostridia bacterium]